MYIYTVKIEDKLQEVISLLSPEQVTEKGLPPQTIVGTLVNSSNQSETINPDNFIPNPQFIEFLHNVIAKYGPQIAGLVAEAQRQGEGWVYIIDGRCSNPRGHVLPEDIIGAFEIKKGQITSDSYQRNKEHFIFSHKGFFKLESRLKKYLTEEIQKLLM